MNFSTYVYRWNYSQQKWLCVAGCLNFIYATTILNDIKNSVDGIPAYSHQLITDDTILSQINSDIIKKY